MMNEWGVPPIELFSLLYRYAKKLASNNCYVPDIAIAGGFSFEDQIFKGLALGAPYFKLIGMARAPLAAVMVGKTIGKSIREGQISGDIKNFGSSIEEIFVTSTELKEKVGNKFNDIPASALGLYTYFERLSQGLKQLMCGSRKFSLSYISRDDIAALTKEASEISGIPYIMDIDKKEVEKILK